ncbi:MAG: hypothetical protein RR855_11690 [Comamonas sp.]
MPTTLPSPSLATVAGTASSQPQALWQGVVQVEAATGSATPAPQNALVDAPLDTSLLGHWTAAEGLAPPAGQVFWLPTPASASAEERTLEQTCRQQLMQDAMDGRTSLRVLYGAPAQQLRALRECLQLLAQEGDAAQSTAAARSTDADSAASLATALQHGHAPQLRCRDCVDPASEQRLFSRLLGERADPAPGAAQP